MHIGPEAQREAEEVFLFGVIRGREPRHGGERHVAPPQPVSSECAQLGQPVCLLIATDSNMRRNP